MKHPLIKSPRAPRWFLVSGLLLSLGFSLSWNPENTLIARYETLPLGSVELASDGGETIDYVTPRTQREADRTAPAPVPAAPAPAARLPEPPAPAARATELTLRQFSLREYDSSLAGVNVRLAIDGTETGGKRTIMYQVEGDICGTCVGIRNLTVSNENLNNMEFLKMTIAQDALQRIKDTNARRKEETAKETAAKKDEFESSCSMDLKDGLIDCQKSELLDLANKCNDLTKATEKSACVRKAERFFSSKMVNNLRKGLSAMPGSELFEEAVAARDELITDLPSRHDESIRKVLVALTTTGIFNRTQAVYDMAILSGLSPQLAATQAKAVLQSQGNQLGGFLRNSLMTYGQDSGDAFAMQRLFMTAYQNPLLEFIKKDHANGLSFPNSDLILGGTTGLGNESIPTLIPGLQPAAITPGIFNGRTGGQRTGPGIPNAFGQPTPNGLPAAPVETVPNRTTGYPVSPAMRQGGL